MKAHVIGNAAADDTQKLGAFLNARMRSTVCESNFSAAQKIQGARVQMALEACYKCKEVYLTYRKTFIAVKVHQPESVLDKKNLKLLEAQWDAKGYTKKVSPQGITYTIPKV